MQTQNASLTTSNVETLPIELQVSYYPERTGQLLNDADFLSRYQVVAGDNVYLTEDENKIVINANDISAAIGPQGEQGPIPLHQWLGYALQWQLPTGGWGPLVDLRGQTGIQGVDGKDGVTFAPVFTQTTPETATVSWIADQADAPVPPPYTVTLPKGQAGVDGADGKAATVNVGITTTLPAGSKATVTNVGNETNAVFNFGIPKGQDGTGGSGGGAVDSVNGQTGVVVLDKADIGLGSVDNTSDTAKPVSTATQNALNTGLARKQDTLVSGTTIKTINGESLLGTGNINVQSGSGSEGTTFTPVVDSVSANEIEISWTNDGSLPNPTPVTLTAPKGDKGDAGTNGSNGANGLPPEHTWEGTSLRFENPDGSWGEYVDLQGPSGSGGSTEDLPVASNNMKGIVQIGSGLTVSNGKVDNAINSNDVQAALDISSKIQVKSSVLFMGSLTTNGTHNITADTSDADAYNVELQRHFNSSLMSEDFLLQVPNTTGVTWSSSGGSTPSGAAPTSGNVADLGLGINVGSTTVTYAANSAMISTFKSGFLPTTNAMTVYSGDCTINRVRLVYFGYSYQNNPVTLFNRTVDLAPNSATTLHYTLPLAERVSVYFESDTDNIELKGVVLHNLAEENPLIDYQRLYLINKELNFSKFGKIVVGDTSFTISEAAQQGYALTRLDAYTYIKPHHVPVGSIMEWYDNVPAPEGWLRDGGVNTSDYPALHDIMTVTPTYSDGVPRIICAEPSTGPVSIVDYYPKTPEEKDAAGGSWYRVWSDGFIEQGVHTVAPPGPYPHVNISWLIPFTSTNYSISGAVGNTASSASVGYYNYYNVTSNSCTIRVYGVNSSQSFQNCTCVSHGY